MVMLLSFMDFCLHQKIPFGKCHFKEMYVIFYTDDGGLELFITNAVFIFCVCKLCNLGRIQNLSPQVLRNWYNKNITARK